MIHPRCLIGFIGRRRPFYLAYHASQDHTMSYVLPNIIPAQILLPYESLPFTSLFFQV